MGGKGRIEAAKRRAANRRLGCPRLAPGLGQSGAAAPCHVPADPHEAWQRGPAAWGAGDGQRVPRQQPDLCGKAAAARGRQGTAAQELPARGAVPRGAPGAGGKTQGSSCCSLVPFPLRRDSLGATQKKTWSLPRYSRSTLRWAAGGGRRDTARFWVPCSEKRNGERAAGVTSRFPLGSATQREVRAVLGWV